MSVRKIVTGNAVNNGDALGYSDLLGNKKTVDRGDLHTVAAYNMYDFSQQVLTVALSGGVAGDNTLVAGVADKQMEVLNYSFTASGDSDVSFRSSTNIIKGPVSVTQGTILEQSSESPLMRTNAGEDLILNSNSSGSVNGSLSYRIL
jgi:hypothetical protein